MGADTLENLNERYEQDNGKDHDEIFVAVVAVVYGYLAESAAAEVFFVKSKGEKIKKPCTFDMHPKS